MVDSRYDLVASCMTFTSDRYQMGARWVSDACMSSHRQKPARRHWTITLTIL